ncbi:het-c2 protein [Irpex rosettiformis]|uniref:Het-c2 protein n=1 Tax=Irpex rosettiformis TaxID=378272 RepID=A0ACB8U1S7_9APHY|nr:het-c2 protein [Irpex rosettiformis]
MAPYLQTVKSFADVPITDAGVDTVAFLEASQGVLGLFDLLGSKAFAPVQSDIKGNIEKVRTRYNAAPTQSATLEELVINEKGEKKRIATEGLLWLLRGLDFTCKALQNAQAKKETELTDAFTEAYGVTLKQYHSFVVRPIFALAMKACPYKKEFYGKLAADPEGGAAVSDAQLEEELNKWLAALASIVTRMQSFYAGGGHDKGF